MDKEMRKMIAKRAAKYFKSGDTVNLGIGIPSLCCDYAESGVMFQSENGFICCSFSFRPGMGVTPRSMRSAMTRAGCGKI